MTSWLKTRLLVLCCGVLLAGGATYLHAQETYKPPAQTPEEAATNFWQLLDRVHSPQNYASSAVINWEELDPLYGSIARAQFDALAPEDYAKKALVLNLLATQAFAPSFDTQVQNSGGRTIVSVAPSAQPKMRDFVIVPEDGGYRVDLIATYGRWKNLSGLDADKSFYKATGWVSPALATQTQFLGAQTNDQCQSNLKQIGFALAMYNQDYDEKLPPARQWIRALQPYVRTEQYFVCPVVVRKGNGYAYNSNLSQFPALKIASPAKTMHIYETSNTGANVFAPFTGRAYRHTISDDHPGMNILFADSHVKWFAKNTEQGVAIYPNGRNMSNARIDISSSK